MDKKEIKDQIRRNFKQTPYTDMYGPKTATIISKLDEAAGYLEYCFNKKIVPEFEEEFAFIDSLESLVYDEKGLGAKEKIFSYGEYIKDAAIKLIKDLGPLTIEGGEDSIVKLLDYCEELERRIDLLERTSFVVRRVAPKPTLNPETGRIKSV